MEINALDKIINKNIKRFVESNSIHNSNRTNKHKNDIRQVLRILKKRKRDDTDGNLQSPSDSKTAIPWVVYKLCRNKYGRKTYSDELRCLLDSGASHSLIKSKYVEWLQTKDVQKEKA